MSWFRSTKRHDYEAQRISDTSSATALSDLESRVSEIGRELLDDARRRRSGLLSPQFWSDQLMQWAMRAPAFKVQLFRFVDVFPMLKTPEQVHAYLVDYLTQPGVTLPSTMELGLKAGSLAKGVLAKTIANRITALAGNFIAGGDPETAIPKLLRRWSEGIALSVDLLGEACVSRVEADAYRGRYLAIIDRLADATARWPANPHLETDHVAGLPRANVSIKITSLAARVDPIDFSGCLDELTEALRPILEAARRFNVFINFDMEQSALKELTIALFQRCCEQFDFPAGLAMQAYLRSGEDDARRMIEWAKRSGRQVAVRLVKGAYWDYEVIHAEEKGWPVPVWTAKHACDACFERMAERFVEAMPRQAGEAGVKLALGSHNVRSIAHTLALLEEHDLPQRAVEFQMLYGMADPLKAAMVDRGLRVREYVPIGEMIPGMAYLVRRLLENTSNQSWLRAGFAEDRPAEELLASPHVQESVHREQSDLIGLAPERHRLGPAVKGLGDGRPFGNEPHRDFSQRDQRERFAAAVEGARAPEPGRDRTAEQASETVARAYAAFPAWRDMDPVDRSARIVEAAARMRQRRDELAGVVLRESGKTWREADADVCEAIDFCEFYARWAVPLFHPRRLGRFVGELNEVWYQPRGVAVVISPWNFPLAICTGMTTAALTTGNTVVVKPSGATRGIALAMCEALWEAGVPRDVLGYLPGRGSVVGSALVRDRRVAIIAFTGSKEVGLDILAAAGQTGERQGFVKKVVCEMGGKNAILVDESADLDEAVLGVRQSAFGYSGQKCSACSRVIVVDTVHDVFLRRLVESTRALVIGDPTDPGTDIGPVIDASAAEKILEYIEIGKREGRLELACEVPAGLEARIGKPCIGPHIFSGILPHHRLANEEIFGPVLSVLRAADFQQGLEWANTTTYKLTGGLFSRRPAHLDAARRRFRVGNLYLNRGITGALVGRQPFGGFGLSGTGTKAGGDDYLLNFVEPRSSTENTMRHGFAPGEPELGEAEL
ncbi:MAG: bifunctional proline dehydrogenase/L-glutamate gamma-semialdehyde dehydrogenase [Pirellulales bacterium]|nr:bifunctional proline dehydrogenase/L-glutamate gamma-semialdehyde dehydrogenase [Pirellulales bacterium]